MRAAIPPVVKTTGFLAAIFIELFERQNQAGHWNIVIDDEIDCARNQHDIKWNESSDFHFLSWMGIVDRIRKMNLFCAYHIIYLLSKRRLQG